MCEVESGGESERARDSTRKGGTEEKGAVHGAHDSIRAVRTEPTSKQGFHFPCCAYPSFRQRKWAVNIEYLSEIH